MKLLAISVVSWIIGLVTYGTALKVLWGQTISGGDLNAVLGWSGVAAAVAVGLAFAPVMLALRRRLRSHSAGL